MKNTWWKRRPEVNPFTPKRPETAEEMNNIADECCERITRVCFDDLLKLIWQRSAGGNKTLVIPATFFDWVSVTFGNGEQANVRPTIDFKLLKTLLTDRGFNVVCKSTGEISSIFWVINKNKL